MRAVITPPAVSILRNTLIRKKKNETRYIDVPEGQGRNVEEEEVLSFFRGIAGQDGSLDGGAVGNSLVRVDALVGLLAVEEIGDELDDAGNTGGSPDQDDFVDVGLVDLGVPENFLNGLKGATEQILAKLLETSTSQGGVEIDALKQGVNFNGGLSRGRESTLGTLASSAETANSTGVRRQVWKEANKLSSKYN
jgi:hypothetical protein